MIVLGFFLVLMGLTLWVRRIETARKERNREKTEGENMLNPYVLEHERKLIDDEVYDEYIEWCKFHGELPMEKKGFDEIRMKEWKLQQQIRKAMK